MVSYIRLSDLVKNYNLTDRSIMHPQDIEHMDEILDDCPIYTNYMIYNGYRDVGTFLYPKIINVHKIDKITSSVHNSVTPLREHVTLNGITNECQLALPKSDLDNLNKIFKAYIL